MALNTLSTCLSDLGRPEEALAVEEGLGHYRELAAGSPLEHRRQICSTNSLDRRKALNRNRLFCNNATRMISGGGLRTYPVPANITAS